MLIRQIHRTLSGVRLDAAVHWHAWRARRHSALAELHAAAVKDAMPKAQTILAAR